MKNSPEVKASSSGGWRVWVAWFVLVLFAAEILAALLMPRKDKTFAVSQFAKMPLVFNGRVQPMDSLARNSLLLIRENMQVPLEGNGAGGAWGSWEELRAKGGEMRERRWYQFSKRPKKLKPAEWLLEVMCNPNQADDRYIFVINHPDLRGLLKLDGGVEKSGLHFYRFNDLRDHLRKLAPEVERVGAQKDPSLRTPFDRAVMQLHNAWSLYMRLKNTLEPEDTEDFGKEVTNYLARLPAGTNALAAWDRAVGNYRLLREVDRRHRGGDDHSRQLAVTQESFAELLAAAKLTAGGEPFTKDSVEPLLRDVDRYNAMARMETPLVVPPKKPEAHGHGWQRMGEAMLAAPRDGVPDSVRLIAGMTSAYRAGSVEKFNGLLGDYRALLEKKGLDREVRKGAQESFFNHLLAFKRSMYVYIAAFLLVMVYWAGLNETWRVAAWRMILLGFIVHTAGLIFRMWLEGRPPVTNLYSSAIFIGWGAVALGLILERFYKDGIGLVVASAVGFGTLIIAHQLSFGGDTMEMMQAVLDTNFWLATHVVIITLGYASTFVAGFLGLVYILRGVFTTTLGEKTGKSMARMAYAIICFATLFSFVGTVLGGIWADQSWGRFWGWDPKENGALIIVLWNALILHLRWGKIIRERGLMNCVIVGNIVTGWSWFGVNLLGIGLHSYGFMDAAFTALLVFVSSQLLLIANGLIPTRFWASAPETPARKAWWPRAVAVAVPAVAALLWWRAGVWSCFGLSAAYLLVMLCVAFVDLRRDAPDAPSAAQPPPPSPKPQPA